MDNISALQLVALRDVIKGSGDYNIRYIIRWYSKTFHTPLHVVEDLPIDDILQAFFEVRYEEMPDEMRHQEIVKLLETEEQKAARRKAEDEADAEGAEFAAQAEKQIVAKEAKKVQVEQKKADSFQKAADSIPDLVPVTTERPPPDIKIHPDIKMTFVEDNEFEDILDGGFGPPPKKPE